MESLTLSGLYTKALGKAAKAFNLPTTEEETQELLQDALSDLVQLASRITNLSLFSSNEVLDDISTQDLVYLSISFIRAEVHNRVRTTKTEERLGSLTQVQHHLNVYISSLETYGIVPETERVLHGQQTSSIRDTAKRREVKIRQYRAEKDLQRHIQAIRRRWKQPVSEDSLLSNFELVASLLYPSDDDVEDLEAEDIHREATLLLHRLFYAQACTQLQGVDQEAQLLRSTQLLPPSPVDERKFEVRGRDVWRVDAPSEYPNRGPLLDRYGKPLRPFTILPAGESDRTRLNAQVFGPGHRLPTMTVDEYLEVERLRGGILSSRRPESEAGPTSEQLTINSEMDGRVWGELKEEEKRRKDEQWAQYKDAHPRGAGNTMNRG